MSAASMQHGCGCGVSGAVAYWLVFSIPVESGGAATSRRLSGGTKQTSEAARPPSAGSVMARSTEARWPAYHLQFLGPGATNRAPCRCGWRSTHVSKSTLESQAERLAAHMYDHAVYCWWRGLSGGTAACGSALAPCSL